MIVTRIKNRIRSNWIELRPVRSMKVVGIGLPKTGTTSLGYCMRRFGFKHRTYDMHLAAKVKKNQLADAMRDAEKFESFEDWPWFMMYREFDQTFPNSKFILTLRKDTDTYVRSLMGHHEREGIRNKDFVKPPWWDVVHEVEPAAWDYEKSARRYEKHNRDVLEYFADRINKDLLVVCWKQATAGQSSVAFSENAFPTKPSRIYAEFGNLIYSRIRNPTCWKWLSAVNASVRPLSSITTKEMQSMRPHSLSRRSR